MLKQTLQKFEQLSEEKKRFLSSPMVLSSLEEVEKKYKIKLALILMEVAVDKNKADNLANFLENRLALEKNIAFQISRELEESIFREFNIISDFKNERQAEPAVVSRKIMKVKDEPIKNINIKSEEKIATDRKQDEIEKKENEIKELKSVFIKSVDWEREAEKIISRLDINFKKDLLKNRFKYIIISAIKGVRSQIDFKDILRRRENEAGMEFSGEIVDKILSVVKIRKQKIENGDGLEKQKQEKIKDQAIEEKYDLPLVSKSGKITPDAENKNIDNVVINDKKQKILSPPPPAVIKQDSIENKSKKEEQSIDRVLDKKQGKDDQLRQPVDGGKKIEDKKEPAKKRESFMDFLFSKSQKKDIKPKIFEKKEIKDVGKIISVDEKSKLVGPVDELSELTIKDFRSWSENPYEAIKKIKEKINILVKESLEKGSLGMKAWKKSEINKIYLDILHNAIIKRKQVDDIIEEMKNEKKQILTLEEFEAIEQLNRELRV
ncbi:MAG: hypothetical protein U9O55_02205 [Patescibacteria group bacterium]|nr:hypothetical protein [Patescibacteria group bacterium]